MIGVVLHIGAILGCAMLVVLGASGQTRDSAALRGRVVDATGAAVASAELELTNSGTGLRRSTTTDKTGNYAFFGLPLGGTYTVMIRQAGFSEFRKGRIDLAAGETATLDCTLAVAGANTTVVVYGMNEGVQADSARLQTTLDAASVDEVPVLGRKLSSVPLTNSAIRPARGTGDVYLGNTLFVVDGGGRRQTTFTLDNATADDSWGRQTFFTNIPIAAVQEFSVLTNALSAEYGRTTGGAINVVTKSGANNFHGDVLALWRPPSLEANPPAAIARAAEKLGQGSAGFSGPLARNHTFFSLSAEYSAQDRDSYISSALGPGIYTGEYRQGMGLARLDHQFSPQHLLALRLNLDRFHDTNPSDSVGALNLPSTARTYERHTYAAELSDTAALSATLLNQARIQWQLGSPMSKFTPLSPSPQFSRAGLGVEGESRSNLIFNHQYQFADTIARNRGRHNLKLGADVIYSSSGGMGQEFGGGYVLGQFTVNPRVTRPLAQLTIADITRYTQSFGNLNYHVDETLWALFLQDDITLTSTLNVNLGLRYERQTFTDDTKNFAPRVGFAYKLPDKSTVLRGSYNVFFSELRANQAANWIINGPEGIFTFSAAPGELGFPTTLAALPAFPIGGNMPARDIWVRPGQRAYLSRFFDVSALRWYPDALLNPYTQQWSLGIEHELTRDWLLSIDYIGQHTIRIDRPMDLNAPAPFVRTTPGRVRSAATADATRGVRPVPGGYKRIIGLVNEGAAYYDGLQVNVKKRLSRRVSALASYTWSHTLNTVEPDASSQDPNDANFLGRTELANSLLDQRQRFVLTGWYQAPWDVTIGTSTTLASGRPFNVTTGVDNNGDGANSDRPVVNGVVVPRNWGTGSPSYDVATFVEKAFRFGERFRTSLRAEAYNLLNHQNVVGRNGVYGNATSPNSSFGTVLPGVNNVDPGRVFQFEVRVRF